MSEPQKNYYAIIPANVRYDDDLTPNAKLLYGEITALCNEKGFCWAKNDYFSKLYKVSKTSISKWISQLVNGGYITNELIYKEGTKEIEHRYLRLVQGGNEQKLNTPIEDKLKDNNTVINNTINNTKDIKDIALQKQDSIDYEGLVNYLNFKTNKNYKHSTKKTRDLIKARLNEGFTLQDFKTVIDKKCDEWLNDGYWNTFLRPETLFGNKFEGYLNQADIRGNKQGKKLDPWEAQLHEHYGSEQNTHDNNIGIPFDDKKFF